MDLIWDNKICMLKTRTGHELTTSVWSALNQIPVKPFPLMNVILHHFLKNVFLPQFYETAMFFHPDVQPMRGVSVSSGGRRRRGGLLQDARYYVCQSPVAIQINTILNNPFPWEIHAEDEHHVGCSCRGVAVRGYVSIRGGKSRDFSLHSLALFFSWC